MAGKFLYNDKSVRVDLIRQFNEIEFGFFVVRSNSAQTNGGFNVSIPIFPNKYSSPTIIRIRPTDYFSWEYKIRGEIPAMIGIKYNTGNYFLKKDKEI